MSSRPGFTLLEAGIALMIVATVGIAVLESIGQELRTVDKVRYGVTAEALANDRYAALELLDPRSLRVLPDSLAQGNFAPPFERFSWRSSADAVVDRNGIYTVQVDLIWPDGNYRLQGRLYRPELTRTSP